MSKPKISLCMIVKDEEQVISKALRSAMPFVDEVIVVDTGSTDHTVEIAAALGATIGHYPWGDDFSAARNLALDLTSGDWILSLDADEELDPKTGGNLRQLASRRTPALTVYGLLIKTVNDQDGIEQWGSFFATRLFPRHPSLRWRKPIHEQIYHLTEENLPVRVMTPDVVIFHYGYLNEGMDQKDKDNRNLSILSAALQDTPNDGTLWHDMGRQHYSQHRWEEAILPLAQCLVLAEEQKAQAQTWAAYAYMMLTGAYAALGRWQEGIELGRKALQLHSYYGSLWANLGLCHHGKGEYLAAVSCFQNTLQLVGQPTVYEQDDSTSTWKSWWNMGNSYKEMGELVKAIECYWEAQAARPDVAEPRLGAAMCLSTLGEVEMAQSAVREVLGIQPENLVALDLLTHLDQKVATLA